MSKLREVKEVRNDYIDEQNLVYIDVFFDNEEDSSDSLCIGTVCLDTGKVSIMGEGNLYGSDPLVVEAIKEKVDEALSPENQERVISEKLKKLQEDTGKHLQLVNHLHPHGNNINLVFDKELSANEYVQKYDDSCDSIDVDVDETFEFIGVDLDTVFAVETEEDSPSLKNN